ncbi:hypothetical protein BLNAU_9065 [Blattamonas nauphoetae]|uniref:Serine-threonine/tyrosine-protein kinase catalytic domain-containing protein n=1 Tax=Blattamonas nauphoetae TaxID=2049346 RepID=A0ABQ9XWP2_9EUKA|nr:hypothetical protein BLNAU_9065 [Blattamonas nauphoetae]
MTTTTTEMNYPISISLSTDFSGSVDSTGSNTDQFALFSEIQNESVSSFMQEFMREIDNLPWTRLMEWFVEAAIGVELFRKHDRSAPPLSFENIRIDGSATILIADPSSTEQEPPSISGSLASDLSTISSFFLDIHRTLDQTKRLIPPLDFNNEALVYSRIMVALLEHFIASGDLILPDSFPPDHFQDFLAFYNDCFQRNPDTIFYLSEPLARVFCHTVLSPSESDCFVPTPHSFLRGSDVERSEQLLNAVRKVKETRSLEVVRNLHFDWKEWVTMMEMVEKGVTALTDLSFLQSRCFRPTLEALQAKHQHRANQPRIEERSRTESSSGDLWSEQFPMPFRFKGSQHSPSTISTETRLPSHHSSFSDTQHSSSSSDTKVLSSPQPARPNPHTARDASSIHSLEILTVLHSLLSKQQIDSFPWKLRSKLTSEKELELALTLSTIPASLDERFGPSMFDVTDDITLVQSLNRCFMVIKTTQSLQCIDDLDSFFAIVIAGLHNSSQIIASLCLDVFIPITEYLPSLDPCATQFRTLQSAFRDGTRFEQMALLNLWRLWLSKRAQGAPGRDMEGDIDFVGFLAADLTDTQFFDEACRFVLFVFSSSDTSMTEQWKSDFILQFEKRHHMLDRLAGKPGPWTNEMQSSLTLKRHHIFIAEALSVLHGFDFPSELTELITIDLDSSPHWFEERINQMFHLCYTSIAPKHRLSFFPMDLMFERYLRDFPIDFFQNLQPPQTAFSMRRFLNTPVVGLHSLLVRCVPLHFNERTLSVFLIVLGYLADQQVTSDEFHQLYSSFPPPRLLDLLLSSPHLVKVNKDHWTKFLFILLSLCGSVAPFEACSSLAKVFKMLAPFDSNPDDREVTLLRFVGDLVVSLHWLSIPAHFDSPLLCHLPSLAGAQRGVLQTLHSHSGIPSLVTPLTSDSFIDNSSDIALQNDSLNRTIAFLIMFVRSVQFPILYPALVELTSNGCISRFLLSHTPAHVSAALECYHRFVSVVSDAIRMELVSLSLLDHVVFAVSNSSFLDDYEKGKSRPQYTLNPKIIVKTTVNPKITRGLARLARERPHSEILSKLTSHWVLFDANDDVFFQLHISKDITTISHPILEGGEKGEVRQNEEQRWVPPEEADGKAIVDARHGTVFRLDLVLWEIETGLVPFGEFDAINAQRQLKSGILPKMDRVSPEMAELIENCLQIDPLKRPTLASISQQFNGKSKDVVIDRSFSFHIQSTSDDPPLPLRSSSTFASDLPLLASYFGDFLESLQSCDRLFPPPDIDNEDILTIITLTCVRHLVQCGLLTSEKLAQQDLLQHIHHQLISHLQSLTIDDSCFFARYQTEADRLSLYQTNLPLDFLFQHRILQFIESHRLTLSSASSAMEALMLVFPRLVEIGDVLQRYSGAVEWRRFQQFVNDLADRKIDCSDLAFLSDRVFVTPLREILEEVQNQTVNTPNSESDRSWTHSNLSSSLSPSFSSSSVPFDTDQRFFTSVNERPPSPSLAELSFFGSEIENLMRETNRSISTDTGPSLWTNMTQLSSKERIFVVETIHTILSRQQDSDRTPSTLTSRTSPIHHLQPLSHSPLFFSSSIFDLDDTSLTDCLGQLAQLAQHDQTSSRCELSQPFVDGLVGCLGSSNTILSNRARLVLTRMLPLFLPFLLPRVAFLASTLSEGTYDETSFALRVMGHMIREGFAIDCISETLVHQICRTNFVEKSAFVDALTILSIPERSNLFPPHSPSVVESFRVLVNSSFNMASHLLTEHVFRLSSDRLLCNVCLSLFVYQAFESSRRNNRLCSEEVVELLFRPHFFKFELRFLNYTSTLFIQTFPFELMIERMIRSCQFLDVLQGLLWWVILVMRHPHPLRDLFSTLHPFFLRGFHQILLSPPPHPSRDWNETSEWNTVGQELFYQLAKSENASLLPDLFPVENLLTLRAQILTTNRWCDNAFVDDLNLVSFPSFTPFGECHALRSIFSILCQPGVQSDIMQLEHIAVVSSHSLPLHFANPLLSFIQTLHPLIHTSREELYWFFAMMTVMSGSIPYHQSTTHTKTLNSRRNLFNLHHAPRFVLKWLHPSDLMTTMKNLLSLSPVQVSLALLTLARAVDASQQACQWLVRAGAVDVVVESVSRSRFLEDYEHGCAIICALLRATREDEESERLQTETNA